MTKSLEEVFAMASGLPAEEHQALEEHAAAGSMARDGG